MTIRSTRINLVVRKDGSQRCYDVLVEHDDPFTGEWSESKRLSQRNFTDYKEAEKYAQHLVGLCPSSGGYTCVVLDNAKKAG